MDALLSIYGCVFLVGVLGNGSLGLALCCGPGARTRSPLLLGLIAADLVVCGLSGPVTAALYAVNAWNQTWKNIALFFQAWPISASTLSMMAISIDRYLTVKNYRPAGQVVRRRYLLASVVAATWMCAAVLSTPNLIPRYPWRTTLTMVVVVIVHIVPACAVLISHLGVHAKLTALSLTARAKHGELPLPMPLLRRPTHVIIVAGISKEPSKTTDVGTWFLVYVKRRYAVMASALMTVINYTAKTGLQKETNDIEDDTEPPTSTLRSRRRLANSLLWVAGVFAVCWFPHVICQFCDSLDVPVSTHVQRYSLLLGHIHSALSPLLYWSLNHQWLQRPCKFRIPPLYRSASSTNEAALGPFHPRYVRPPPMRRRSSHYLY